MSLVAAYSGSSDESDEDDNIVQSVANTAVIKKTNHILSTNDVKISESEKHNDIPVNNCNNSNVFNNVNGSDYDSKLANSITADISDEEDDVTAEKSDNDLILSDTKDPENKTLFTLPAPKITKLHDIDFDWSRLSKGVKGVTQPIKISVPSLADLNNDESTEPVKKKLKPSKKGSGLFALLPSPKNTFIDQTKTTLKPQQINKKVQERIKSQTKVENKFLNTKSILSKKNKLPLSVDYDDSPDDESADDTKTADFFSLSTSTDEPTSEVQLPDIDLVSGSDRKEDSLQARPQNYQAAKASTSFVSSETSASNASTASTEKAAESTSYIPLDQEDIQLDETALQQLCGRRDRHKGGTNLQIIDVSGDAIMPDAREWLTKQLTEEKNTNIQSHKKKDGPTTQQRRKHQITYLAFQAKEHELELKNQWANNRMSRKQTQAKYGF